MFELSDEDILSRSCVQGHEDLFGDLVRRYEGPLSSFLRRLTGDPGSAGDLLQQAWIRAYQGRAQFRREAKVKTWLFAIALNQYRDWRRRRRRSPTRLAAAAPDESGREAWEERLADPAPQALDQLLGEERRERVWQAVGRLPEQQRQVILMVYQQGLGFQESARLLGKSPESVKMQAYRAIQSLGRSFARGPQP